MRQLFRVIIQSFTILSLMLCVATCLLWIDSYRGYTRLELGDPQGPSFSVASDAGRIGISRTVFSEKAMHPLYPAPGRQIRRWYRITSWVGLNWGPGGWALGGFDLKRSVPRVAMAVGVGRQVGTTDTLRAPYWFLTAATILLPALAIVRVARRFRGRARRGFCLGCGYDLRATPGRCPECGTVT